jgi:exodeoxyribonuclease V beta subunit
MSGPMHRFDLSDPLPQTRLAIEASAGTGKTFTLAALATRYVVELGVPVAELAVVTFTRVAAAQLRDRLRARLAAAVVALSGALAGEDPEPGDDLLVALCREDVALRLDRARDAIADFDAATVTTIHGFAQQVLGSLGSSVAGDDDVTLGDDGGELLRQVCSDVLVGEGLGTAQPRAALVDLLPSHAELVKAARDVTGNPGIRAVPGTDPAESNEAAALRRRLVDRVAAEMDRRRATSGAAAFDDVLTRLRGALAGEGGAVAVEAVRRRFRVALIDEFQDTDPVQWEIFRTLFGGEGTGTALVMVGDPKQAIYGFRGANVHTYLDAVATPGTDQAVLGTNWRSDEAVLAALDALLDGATFGDARIPFLPVEASPPNVGRVLADHDGRPLPGVAIRLALDADLDRTTSAPFAVRVDAAERVVFADLARTIRDLLELGTVPEGEGRPVRPNDIAVLVAAHAESPKVRDALTELGVPAVIARGDTVLRSPAATQWRWLLEAVAQPANVPRARTVSLSWFVGWPAEHLVAARDDELAAVQERLHRWSEVLVDRGVPEFLRAVWAESGVAARILRTVDGDRSMTDLDHIAELLAAAAPRHTGPAGLLATLDQLTIETTTDDVEVDAAARRIESDADAVQIMTMHAAKGLEFPIVCCPSLWRKGTATARSVIYQDPDDHRRTVDVAWNEKWPTSKDATKRKALAAEEAAGQSLRLMYVALTRGQHQTVVWWTRSSGSELTGLARVLFARDETGVVDGAAFDRPKVQFPADADAAAFLDPLVAAAKGRLAVEEIPTAPDRRPWAGPAAPSNPPLAVARLGRQLDRSRRRLSFSAITADAHVYTLDPQDVTLGDAGAADEAIDGETIDLDRLDDLEVPVDVTPARDARPLPLGGLRGSADFGVLVHGVLEHVDFTASDLQARLADEVAEASRRAGFVVDEPVLVAGLAASVRSSLGPLLGDRTLAETPPSERLNELDFELTLGDAGRHADDAEIAGLLLRHLPVGDPLRPWADALLERPFGVVLAGHLVGSIDVVLRVTSAAGTSRFVVVDYKTNDLTPRGATPSIDDYRPDRLAAAMSEHDYPLQALLYSVALHRYLRWRLADYDPAVHLGGVAYLFVRGMIGPDTPVVDGAPHGVFSWAVPPRLVESLSDLLDGLVAAP